MECPDPKRIFQLCDHIRLTAYQLHRYHAHGHLEKVYERGLAHRLQAAGLHVLAQAPIPVRDEDGMLLGDYFADLLVEGVLVVEVKACRVIARAHVAQLLGYLRSSRLEHGLLVNFGAPKLQIRKLAMKPT